MRAERSTKYIMRIRYVWHSIGAGLILFVIYQSVTPHPITIHAPEGDKYGHIVAYGTLMYWYALMYRQPSIRMRLAFAFVAFGVGLECIQGLTEYRTFDVADMVVDVVGVTIGWGPAPPRLPNPLQFVEGRLHAFSGS